MTSCIAWAWGSKVASNHLQDTKKLRELQAFANQNRNHFSHALATIRAWGESGKQLQLCIAIAIKQAHEAGLRGEDLPDLGYGDEYRAYAGSIENFAIDCNPPPPAPEPMRKRLTRSAPAPTPPSVRRIGRSRA